MKTELMPVPFYGDTLVLVNEEGTPFVAMKAIVENLGLSWHGQHVKMNEKFGSSILVTRMVAEDGKTREMICLPLRKLPAWLYSINPTRVKPELRDKIIQYQNECDDALWDYWTQGQATRPGAQLPKEVNNAALQADKLAERLIETTHPERRRILWAGLDRYCKMLGIATPALEDMRPLTPPEPAELVQFWATVNTLQDACGVRLNHSRHPHVMALNLNECARAALVHGLTIPPLHVLKPLLRQGQRYAMLGIKDVSSRHTQRTVHCWLFAPEQAANLPAHPPS